jgi:hypothetical protein
LDGKVIYETEQDVLKNFIRRDLGLPQALAKAEMGPGSGQKETFAKLDYLIAPVKNQIELSLHKTASRVA